MARSEDLWSSAQLLSRWSDYEPRRAGSEQPLDGRLALNPTAAAPSKGAFGSRIFELHEGVEACGWRDEWQPFEISGEALLLLPLGITTVASQGLTGSRPEDPDVHFRASLRPVIEGGPLSHQLTEYDTIYSSVKHVADGLRKHECRTYAQMWAQHRSWSRRDRGRDRRRRRRAPRNDGAAEPPMPVHCAGKADSCRSCLPRFLLAARQRLLLAIIMDQCEFGPFCRKQFRSC